MLYFSTYVKLSHLPQVHCKIQLDIGNELTLGLSYHICSV